VRYFRAQNCLSKLLIFDSLDENVQMKIVKEMYERQVMAGDILIQEGDSGLAASELYVVKSGEFEILERRQVQQTRGAFLWTSDPLSFVRAEG
jgi:hypothetical protein